MMKAGEVNVIQYDTAHGGMRIMPLCSVAEIGRLETLSGERHTWIVVGYATDEGKAHERMQAFKDDLKNSGETKPDRGLFDV